MMKAITLFQSTYYIITGLWPVFHIVSFEKLTGKKTDKWLVQQVGLLAAGTGIALLAVSYSDKRIIGMLAAAAFILIDFYYPLVGRISKIYWIDGAIQLTIVFLWVIIY
jgi:hypothetical protein